MIDLPIRFPTQEEVVTEEVSRFRGLTAEEQVGVIGEMFTLYHSLLDLSGRRAHLEALAIAEEANTRHNLQAFLQRHARI